MLPARVGLAAARLAQPGRPARGGGGDKLHLVRIALGSLREVGAVLDIAAAHGWLNDAPLAAERDRLGALLYGLQRR